MKCIIFSGTTEGRMLSHKLAHDGAEVTVSVATEYGEEQQGFSQNIKVLCGRMTLQDMRRQIADNDLCIDATHPYAVIVTDNIRRACQLENIKYLRLLRQKSAVSDGIMYMKNAEQAVQWLTGKDGNIMLATGAKELEKYAPAGAERLYPRVLPLHSSIDLCEKAGIPHKNIIAMQGPFTENVNKALLEQYNIKYMVTKDGGKNGGFDEKIQAAKKAGVQIIVLERPDEQGFSYEQIVEKCREMIKCRLHCSDLAEQRIH